MFPWVAFYCYQASTTTTVLRALENFIRGTEKAPSRSISDGLVGVYFHFFKISENLPVSFFVSSPNLAKKRSTMTSKFMGGKFFSHYPTDAGSVGGVSQYNKSSCRFLMLFLMHEIV